MLTLSNDQLNKVRAQQISMIFQDPMTSLNPYMRVSDQMAEVLELHEGLSHRAAVAESVRMLDAVRIPDAKNRVTMFPHEFSGGMRQRVMIAMSLLCKPRLLIADEPTTALDVTIQAQILDLIKTLQRETGTAVLLITHDLGVVAEVADQVAVMYAGKIVELAPVEALFDDPQHPYTLGLMSSIPRIDGESGGVLPTIAGSVPPPTAFPAGCRFSSRCPFADARCRAEEPPLVDLAPNHGVACWKVPLERALAADEDAA